MVCSQFISVVCGNTLNRKMKILVNIWQNGKMRQKQFSEPASERTKFRVKLTAE